MKYITSCPQCDTQFLLNDDLIKAYRGKVQCGNCEHVFNAKNRLTEVSDDINSAEEYQASLEDQDDDIQESAEPITPTPDLEEEQEENLFSIDFDDEPAIEPEEVEVYINDDTDQAPQIIEQTTTAVIASPSNIDDFSKHISPTKQKKARKSRPVYIHC